MAGNHSFNVPEYYDDELQYASHPINTEHTQWTMNYYHHQGPSQQDKIPFKETTKKKMNMKIR